MILLDGLEKIKELMEEAIELGGEKGKRSLITSQKPINILHEVIKYSLINNGINPNLIRPQIGKSGGEITLAGFLKFKKQDICVLPNNLPQVEETINFNGLFNGGAIDPYGETFTEHILTINVRSQLSSLEKNIDTMFERTYAEPLNLHRRLPKMVLGEVYLISLKELDSSEVINKKVVYKQFTDSKANYLEKCINGFSALNMRNSQRDDDFKYERIALIIADFSKKPVKLYNATEDLLKAKLLPQNSKALMDNMDYYGFIRCLLETYNKRFGSGILS